MRKATLLAVTVALVLCGQASAVTISEPADPTAGAIYQQWANASLMPTPTGVVRVIPAPCPGSSLAADTTSCEVSPSHPPLIYLPDLTYVQDPQYSTQERLHEHLRFLVELGHALDDSLRSHRYRGAYEHLMGLRGSWDGVWTDGSGQPTEQFGVAYSLCAVFPTRPEAVIRTWAQYGFDPTARQYRRVCALIHRL